MHQKKHIFPSYVHFLSGGANDIRTYLFGCIVDFCSFSFLGAGGRGRGDGVGVGLGT